MGISGPGVVSAVNLDSGTDAAAIFLESIGLEVVSIRVTGGRAAGACVGNEGLCLQQNIICVTIIFYNLI
jgi:hypothetical protein